VKRSSHDLRIKQFQSDVEVPAAPRLVKPPKCDEGRRLHRRQPVRSDPSSAASSVRSPESTIVRPTTRRPHLEDATDLSQGRLSVDEATQRCDQVHRMAASSMRGWSSTITIVPPGQSAPASSNA